MSNVNHPPKDHSTGTGNQNKKTIPNRRKWKKPKSKPKRPLSAYNIFFAHRRQALLKNGILKSVKNYGKRGDFKEKADGVLGFEGLARAVAADWKTLDEDEKSQFQRRADAEKRQYKRNLDTWKLMQVHAKGNSLEQGENYMISTENTPSMKSRDECSVEPHHESEITHGQTHGVYSTQIMQPQTYAGMRLLCSIDDVTAHRNSSSSSIWCALDSVEESFQLTDHSNSLWKLASELDGDEYDFLSSKTFS